MTFFLELLYILYLLKNFISIFSDRASKRFICYFLEAALSSLSTFSLRFPSQAGITLLCFHPFFEEKSKWRKTFLINGIDTKRVFILRRPRENWITFSKILIGENALQIRNMRKHYFSYECTCAHSNLEIFKEKNTFPQISPQAFLLQ